MKSFDDFKKYLGSDNDKVFKEIDNQFDSTIEEKKINNLMTAGHAYTQIAILKILGKYHEWLSDES